MVSTEHNPASLRGGLAGAILGRRRLIEPALAFLAAASFYVSLYGELPYHDVFRFIAQIDSGKYFWDMGHVWLQPVTLLWHHYLGFGESAEQSQKHINTVFAAAGVAVFYASLMKFEVPGWRRVLATALVAASCNILTLAPTGHMKLLAFPFLTAGFYYAVAWERGVRKSDLDLVRSGIFLALAACFHSSVLAAPPFVALVILVVSLRQGQGWVRGVSRAALFGAVCALLFLALLEVARVVFFGQFLGFGDFAATVGDKNDLRTGFFSWADTFGRMVFGTVNNFIAAPDLGPVLRAWIAGQIPSLKPYAGELIEQAVPFLGTAALLAAIYLRGLYLGLRGKPTLMPLAFVLGALAWNGFFNINEPEHWFHLTVPTVALFLFVFPGRFGAAILPLWAAGTVAANLALWALPEARYPLNQYQSQLRQEFTDRDLLLYFTTYGGGPNLSFFKLTTPSLAIDDLYEQKPDAAAFYAAIEAQTDAAFARGGSVVVFQALDPGNWNAPWMILTRAGMPKAKLTGFFEDHYRVEPMGEIAEMKAWQLLPRQ
ncbi:MAG TPA: hypothetical protein VN795_03105 [Stellaceae bacterium]|nr:hypothetical protein [Stellaceae bacterium]